MMDAVGAIREIFTVSDWRAALSKHMPLLAHVVGDTGEEKQRLAA